MKKFWKYFLILILLLTGLFCVGLLYLFFVPGSQLFNITYISYKDKYTSNLYSMNAVSSIELTSRAYDVEVVESTTDDISVVVQAKSFGYVLTKNSKVEIKSKLVSGVLTFEVVEPHGFAFANSSLIQLRIPKNYNKSLKLTNNKATTTINNPSLVTTNLEYSTNLGNIKLINCGISNSLTLKLNKAKATLSNGIETTDVTLNLELTSGQFIASSHSFNTVYVNKNTNGVVAIKDCNYFISKTTTAGGKFSINKADSVDIESSDTNVEISELHSGTIKLTATGSITVNNVNGVCSLITNSGSIKVSNANSAVIANSDSGNINISNATMEVTTDNKYGNTNISFLNSTDSYANTQTNSHPHRKVSATTKNGQINITGVDNVRVGITDNGAGRISIDMHDVAGECNIDLKNGSASIKVPTSAIYELITQASSNGTVNVNLAQLPINGYSTTEYKSTLICPSVGTYVPNGTLRVIATTGSMHIYDNLVS